MISRDSIRKILDTASIVDVVGDYLTLKKAGSIYKANCPFHQEKTPSFVVNPNKNIFKCFGCGKGGDPLNFIMEYEKLSYPEALRFLAQKYAITIEEIHSDKAESIAEQQQTESLYIVLNYATTFFQEQLLNTEDGTTIALSYCKERGLSSEVIKEFQIGYAPNQYDGLFKDATQKGYNKELLLKTGLIKSKEDKNYDFFRDRIMFPIWNLSGKVIAFGGRILKKSDNQPKYINTPETEIYHKSSVLYGIYQAKQQIRKLDYCILVEGYLDVISLFQAGIKNVVASSGTALTKEQVLLIQRFTQNIVILYDGDTAGIKAALRGLDIVLELGLNVKIVLLPEGDDPDTFVRKRGTDATLDYIEQYQQDFIVFKANQGMQQTQNDPVKKAEVIKDIVSSIALINDNIKRDLYLKLCAEIVTIDEKTLIVEVNKIRNQQLKKQQKISDEEHEIIKELDPTEIEHEQPTISSTPKFYYQERDIIRVLLEHADKEMTEEENVGMHILSELVDIPFKNSDFDKVIKYYINAYEQDISFQEINSLNHIEDQAIRNTLIDIQSSLSKYELSPNWFKRHEIIVKEVNRTYKTDVSSILNRYKFLKLMELIQDIDSLIKTAQDNHSEEEEIIALNKKKQLIQERTTLSKEIGTVTHPY